MLEFLIMAGPEALVVFAKQPNPHLTKLRLTPPLSREEAAALYSYFLADVLDVSRELKGVELVLCYHPPDAEAYFAALAPDFRRMAQTGMDLGERMSLAFASLFSEGYRRVVLIGSDLPHIPVPWIQQGFQALRSGAEAVFGPSEDGGYYLVGLTGSHPELFYLPMSTPLVLEQTLDRIRRLNLRLALLDRSFDIDTAADLEKLKALLQADTTIPAQQTRRWLAGQLPGVL